MTSTYGTMVRSLSFVVLSLLLVSCSSKYGSKYEAEVAKDKWIEEGGSTKVKKPVSPVCDYKDDIAKSMIVSGMVDCSIEYTTKINRKCINEKETNQYVCMEMKEDGFDYTYFKY